MVNFSNIFIDFCFVLILYELPIITLTQIFYASLEEKNELLEERALSCDGNWITDLAFLCDITNYLNHLNMK